MNIFYIFFCIWTGLLQGQTCGNPNARLKRLITTHSKDTIYKWIKTDLEFIQPKKQDTIADIGSYDAYYPCLYSVFADSMVFYLNDINTDGFKSLDSIKAVCTQIKGNEISSKFSIVKGDESSTNLKEHMFNKVVVRDALHHFKFMDVMLEDIKRIMKLNARLILFEPIRGRNKNNESLCKGAMTIEELMKLLNRHGFYLIKELPQTIGGSWFEFKLSKG